MRRVSFSSLRVRLVCLGLVVVIPALGFILRDIYQNRQIARQNALQRSLQVAQRFLGKQQQLIESGHQLVEALSHIPQVQRHDAVGCSKLFSNILKSYQAYTNIGAARPNGDVFCSAVPSEQEVILDLVAI